MNDHYDAEREREEALDHEFFGPKNEYEAHYQNMERHQWADPDPERCPCHGRGWVLSQLDTWHECPFHDGPHPEDYMEEFEFESEVTEPSPPAGDTIPTPPPTFEDDDIPF